MSSVSRTSCELQVLDGTIVEKIEEAVEKVAHEHDQRFCTVDGRKLHSLSIDATVCSALDFQLKKNVKKVRVTVKPHLLFRVSANASLPAAQWSNTFALKLFKSKAIPNVCSVSPCWIVEVQHF